MAVPVTATMHLFASVKPWRAAISVRAPIAVRSAIPSTAAGLKWLTSNQPREASYSDLFFGLAHFREVVGSLHPKPQVAAARGCSDAQPKLFKIRSDHFPRMRMVFPSHGGVEVACAPIGEPENDPSCAP